MEWQRLIDERILHRSPYSRPKTPETIRSAWDCSVAARAAYLGAKWEIADRDIRRAFCVATEALVGYHDLAVTGGCGFQIARRIGSDYFGERLAEPIFDRACLLRSLLPLEPELDEEQNTEVRKSIAASSEYVALVESFTYRP